MATTAVTICSNASLMLGGGSINSFLDDSDRTKLASNLYPLMRDALLRSRPWNFATKRVILAPEVATPPFDYAFQFLQPHDWLKTLQVGEYMDDVDYLHEEGRFLCDESALPLRYIFRNENEASWDSLAIVTITLAMQAVMAFAITKSATKEEACYATLDRQLRVAGAIDGQDDPSQTLGNFRLIASRHGRVW